MPVVLIAPATPYATIAGTLRALGWTWRAEPQEMPLVPGEVEWSRWDHKSSPRAHAYYVCNPAVSLRVFAVSGPGASTQLQRVAAGLPCVSAGEVAGHLESDRLESQIYGILAARALGLVQLEGVIANLASTGDPSLVELARGDDAWQRTRGTCGALELLAQPPRRRSRAPIIALGAAVAVALVVAVLYFATDVFGGGGEAPAAAQAPDQPGSSEPAVPPPIAVGAMAPGDGAYKLVVSGGDATTETAFWEATAVVMLPIRTEPGAVVIAGGQRVEADADGIAAVPIRPADLLREWFAAVELPATADAIPVATERALVVTAERGDARASLTLSVNLSDTIYWWQNLQFAITGPDELSPATDGALGILLWTPHGGLQYAGPGGGMDTVGYIGLSREQDPESRDCGNYVTPGGEVGAVVLTVVEEYAAIYDRAERTVGDGVAVTPDEPCAKSMLASTVGREVRPEPQWSTGEIVEAWSKHVARRGLWGPMVKVFVEEAGAWYPAVVIEGDRCTGDTEHTRIPSLGINWDRCSKPEHIRGPKRRS